MKKILVIFVVFCVFFVSCKFKEEHDNMKIVDDFIEQNELTDYDLIASMYLYDETAENKKPLYSFQNKMGDVFYIIIENGEAAFHTFETLSSEEE